MRFEDDDIGQLALDGRRQMRQGPDVHQFLVDDLQIVGGPIVSPVTMFQVHSSIYIYIYCWWWDIDRAPAEEAQTGGKGAERRNGG